MTYELGSFKLDFNEPALIERYFNDQSAVFVHDVSLPDQRGLYLDLGALPTEPLDFKGAVLRWLISVNLPRLQRGEDPLVTLPLVLQCPIWRIIRPPLRKFTLTKEGMFNKPTSTVPTIGTQGTLGRINKR